MAWSYCSTGLGELLCARAVAGIGSSMYMSGATAMLADLSTRHTRARILGANQAAVLAGAAAGPALGGAIAGADGMSIRSPFLAVGALSSFASVYSFARIEETRPESVKPEREFAASKHWYCDGHPIEDTKMCLELDEFGKPVVHRDGQVYELLETKSPDGAATTTAVDPATAQDAAMGRLVKSMDFWAVCGLNAALFFSGAGGRGTLLPILAYQNFGFTPEIARRAVFRHGRHVVARSRPGERAHRRRRSQSRHRAVRRRLGRVGRAHGHHHRSQRRSPRRLFSGPPREA